MAEETKEAPKIKQPPLMDRGYAAAVALIIIGIVVTCALKPDLAPQVVVMVFSVALGVVVADLVLIRREAKLAFRSILSSPEAQDFIEGFRAMRKVAGEACEWWGDHREEVATVTSRFAAMAKEFSEGSSKTAPKRIVIETAPVPKVRKAKPALKPEFITKMKERQKEKAVKVDFKKRFKRGRVRK